MASVPSESDTLAGLEDWNIGRNSIKNAGHFMAWNAWELNAGPLAFFGQRIRVADTAGKHANADLTRAWLREFLFDELKCGTRRGHAQGTSFNGWHVGSILLRLGWDLDVEVAEDSVKFGGVILKPSGFLHRRERSVFLQKWRRMRHRKLDIRCI